MKSKKKTAESCVMPTRSKVLAVGDTHFPFSSSRAHEHIVAIAKSWEPEFIVQLGDLYDQYSFSKYPRSLNVMTPSEEIERARLDAVQMWERLQSVAPKASCYQLYGNHDERAAKRVLESVPSLEHLLKPALKDLYTFKGVTTVNESNDVLEVDGVVYMHGYMGKAKDHAIYNNQSTVTGHLHRGEISFHENKHGFYFSLNAGAVIDRKSPAFGYKNQSRLDKMTVGVGWVDTYGPRFIPLPEK